MREPSTYLRRRMQQRKISEWEIDQVLADPASVTYLSASDDTRMVVLGTTYSARRLKLVVLADDPEFVVTVADRDNEG